MKSHFYDSSQKIRSEIITKRDVGEKSITMFGTKISSNDNHELNNKLNSDFEIFDEENS